MIEYLAATGSTSADIASRLREGRFVPEGHWLVADRQTAGRGRLGREWFDGTGNFMGSTVVHLRFGDPDPATLALLAGLVVHQVVVTLPAGGGALLKWSNDLMIGKAKLAGILLERVADSVIVGIGVNLATAPALPDRQTIALGGADRAVFAADLAGQFDLELSRWRSFGLAPVLRRWLAVAHPIGTRLSVGEASEKPVTGSFVGLTEEGALQLRLADGSTRVIHAGEVRLDQ